MPQGFPHVDIEKVRGWDNYIDLHTKVILKTNKAHLKLELDLLHYLFTMLYGNILKDDWCALQMFNELNYRHSRFA